MSKPLSVLLDKVSPAIRVKAAAKALTMLEEITLAELRKSLGVTQIEVAEAMDIKQPTVARIEKQRDVYVSTVQNYIRSLGGEMELYAAYPDGTKIRIDQFQAP